MDLDLELELRENGPRPDLLHVDTVDSSHPLNTKESLHLFSYTWELILV